MDEDQQPARDERAERIEKAAREAVAGLPCKDVSHAIECAKDAATASVFRALKCIDWPALIAQHTDQRRVIPPEVSKEA